MGWPGLAIAVVIVGAPRETWSTGKNVRIFAGAGWLAGCDAMRRHVICNVCMYVCM